MDGSGTFWYNGDRGTKADALMKRLPLVLLPLTTLDYWGGVAAFRTFQQACALLPEQGSDAVCSAVYGQLLLHPDGAKAHLPEIIAVMEPLAQDPTDASARLRLYELRDLLQEDA